MSLGIISTKRRIKSIATTRKITKAMELVASAKLRQSRDRFTQISIYAEDVYQMVLNVLANMEKKNSKYAASDCPKTLYIVITSNIGLCGAYNSNIIKYLKNIINQDDKLIVFGRKGESAFADLEVEIIDSYCEESSGRELDASKAVAKKALDLFVKGEVGKVNFVYTEFINSLKIQPKERRLLPVDFTFFENIKPDDCLLFEPNQQEVLDYLLPLYFEAVIYGRLTESQVSENASRRMAMENATDNADDISNKLLIEYNKARQAAITQEINEVVAGSQNGG